MTLSTTINKASYSGDGNTATFNYNFKIFTNSDLKVIIRSASGTETLKTITTHYTVSGAGSNSGGSVTFTGGNIPTNTETVILQRVVPLTQTHDYVENDPFPAESHEQGLDRLTMHVQQLQEEVDRSIKASVSNTISSSEFTNDATDRANKLFAFDGSGDISITTNVGSNKGNWATATAYSERDIVKDTSTNNIFQCKTAHTSSGSQPLTTNTDSAKWDLLVDAESATTSATNSANSATASANSATASANSATQSATSATDSANSATASAGSATTASNHVTSASNHATTASGHATDASEHKQTAERWANLTGSTVTDVDTGVDSGEYSAKHYAQASATTLTNFEKQYLGSKSSAPTADNDGNTLDATYEGTLYFNSTTDDLYVWNGSAWEQASFSAGGFLSQANNLSDVANAGTSRTNLGLGSVATLTAGTSANNAVQLDGSARLPAVDGSQLTNLPASGGSVDKTAKYAITAGQPVGLYSDGKVGLAKNWTDTANLTATSNPSSEVIEVYNNNENNPYIVYSVEHDKYILTSRGPSNASNYARYRVGTKSGNTITWGTEANLVSEDMGKVRLHRFKNFEGNEMFVIVGSGGSNNSGYCRYGTASFDGSSFTMQRSMGNMNTSYLRNYNGNNPSLVSCAGDWDYVRENSTDSSTKPSGTFVFGAGSLNGEWYQGMYQATFFIYPAGSANAKWDVGCSVSQYDSNQFQYLNYSATQSVVAHPTVPSFYFSRKFSWSGNNIRIKRYNFGNLNYTNVAQCSSIGVQIDQTDSGGTNINTSTWGGKDDTAIDLVIPETGTGRCFVIRDKKVYAPKFNPNDGSADGLNSGSISASSGTFNEIVRINTNSSEDNLLDVSARVISGKFFIMHQYYDSSQSSDSDKGRIYYGIRNLTDGISSAVTTEFSDYHQMYINPYQYSQIETCDSGPSGSDMGWATQSRDYSNTGGHAGIWGAISYNINDAYIGIAQSSVSADATVTVKLQGTEDSNQSGLTVAQKVQVKKDDGVITSTKTVDTSTHKEIGIATSASTFLIKE